MRKLGRDGNELTAQFSHAEYISQTRTSDAINMRNIYFPKDGATVCIETNVALNIRNTHVLFWHVTNFFRFTGSINHGYLKHKPPILQT